MESKRGRVNGSVPVWRTAESAKEQTEARLTQALSPEEDSAPSFQLALAETPEAAPKNAPEKPFGFGDLVDIVNPLQHLPVVSTLYRQMTGDEIRGSGRLIGGAIFGGPLGAGSALVNLVVEQETGRDLTETALAFMTGDMFKETDNEDKPSQEAVNRAMSAYRGRV
jgi:hypothetical protein